MNQSELYALYEGDPSPIVAFLDHVRSAYDLPAQPRVLDMGCGPGRLLAPLAALGWTVTGFEPDPDYVEAARLEARSHQGVDVRQAGFQDLEATRSYDLIAAVNGPYCYLLDPVQRRDAIRRSAEALCPGGVLFLDLSNFWWILRNYRVPPPLELTVDETRVTRTALHQFDFHRATMTHHDTFMWEEGGTARSVSKSHAMAMIGYPEIELFLTDAGFDDIRTYNSFDDRSAAPLYGKKLMVAASLHR